MLIPSTKDQKKFVQIFQFSVAMCTVVQVKSKVAAKGGNMTYQWNIMKLLGLKDEEIKKLVHHCALLKCD